MVDRNVATKLVQLRRWFEPHPAVVVAYSGGTDSTLVAAAAARALGERALAVTAVSPSLPPGELAEARRVAAVIGVRHRAVRTRETEDPAYLANGVDRCYHCKSELYGVRGRGGGRAGGGGPPPPAPRWWSRGPTWTTWGTTGPGSGRQGSMGSAIP
jgi:uncharacterized protein